MSRWLFTMDRLPPLSRLVTFEQLGLSGDTTPVKFTHRGDLRRIKKADLRCYNLPVEARGRVGQFFYYEVHSPERAS